MCVSSASTGLRGGCRVTGIPTATAISTSSSRAWWTTCIIKEEAAYAAWPDRLYVVGKDGRIAWKGAPGPKGVRDGELEEAIRKELGR